jgi:hypothetical protein
MSTSEAVVELEGDIHPRHKLRQPRVADEDTWKLFCLRWSPVLVPVAVVFVVLIILMILDFVFS